MLATISPASDNYEETLSTLRWANTDRQRQTKTDKDIQRQKNTDTDRQAMRLSPH